MVNDLIIQKNNLNLNLDPIYVDTKVIRAKKSLKLGKPLIATTTETTATTNNSILSSSPSSSSSLPSIINTTRPISNTISNITTLPITVVPVTATTTTITTKTLTSKSIVVAATPPTTTAATNSIKSTNNKILIKSLNDEKFLNNLQNSSHSTIGYQITQDNINNFDNNLEYNQDQLDNQQSLLICDEQISPILPPPPILKLSSTKYLNKLSKISSTSIQSTIISNPNTINNQIITEISSDLITLKNHKPTVVSTVSGTLSNHINSSILLKNKKKKNLINNIEIINDNNDDYDDGNDNNDLKIIDDGEIIANNLNWKFFDRISLLDDELRDQESCGENNFDDCNEATSSSQEVLLSKSNQLQKNSTIHHHHHNNSEEDHHYTTYNTQTLDSYNSTIITNPHKQHQQQQQQHNRDHTSKLKTSLPKTSSTTTSATPTSIAYVVSDMNSPESPSTSAAVVINNNYTNSNYQNNNNNISSNNNNNSNHNHHSINKNHNKKNNSNNNNNNNTIISNSISPNCSIKNNIITHINQSGGSIGNLRNDTMIGSNITTSENSQGILGQQQQQQQQQKQQQQLQTNSSSLKRKSKKPTGSISGGIGIGGSNSAGGGQGSNNVGGTTSGLYGWRKKCLYILLLILMLLIIINLILTLWILKVMEFSSEGMGQLKIVPGGIQLSGQALIMDLLRASVIRSKHGQPITLESSRNFSINTRDSNGILENHLFLGHDKLECLANGFRINDTTGKNLFSVNRNEVVIGAHHLRIDGEGGVTFRESVQTPHVRAEPSRELRLESPTRQLEMTAAKDINLQSRAGGIDINALDDVKLSSIDGSIRLESSKIFLPNLKPVKLLTSGTSFHENFDKVTQLCACSNGKLFLASPKGHCSDDEGTICR
ncbi:GATA zinc finger domain-containing protein 14 isoform X2 [Condylostylus longicornis]|uniref:GATA zinc finger domain-containing protein 14 isoform X2 n=1 Tax=Condylostylus longicornis TaxID=2530218 RepID=UPI00244E1193|nr:GATA zinc finger domain-containing protein 14 isoform X2 [Condylostylus longicornis]